MCNSIILIFLVFACSFRDQLWAEVDLESTVVEVWTARLMNYIFAYIMSCYMYSLAVIL